VEKRASRLAELTVSLSAAMQRAEKLLNQSIFQKQRMATRDQSELSNLRPEPAGSPASASSASQGVSSGTKSPASSVELSIVVPLYNESENVLPLARRIFEVFAQDRRPLELVLVDDGSTDATWQQILAARQIDGRVRAVRHLTRSGQSAALWTGCRAARAPVVCTLDGDLQNDPADLPEMIKALGDCDLVCGVRTQRQDGSLRRLSAIVARWARRAVLGVDFQDTGCNLRVFKRPLLQKLFPFDGLHRFMPILAHHAGAIVREMPVSHKPRVAGKSKYGICNRLGRGILDLAAMAWYRRRQIGTVEAVEYHDQPDGRHDSGSK
jgi:dolichol-phosphate mannosyltransferase